MAASDEVAPSAAEPVAHPSEISPPATPTVTAAFPTRDELVQAWGDQVIGRLRPKAKALFQAGRFVSADGERARFGLPNEIHRARCEAMRPEVEAALADQFGRPVPLVLVVDGDSTAGTDGPVGDGDLGPGVSTTAAPRAVAVVDRGDHEEDMAEYEAADLEVADVDNSAEARLLQAFPGAEEVV